jgi:2-oxoglutarate dehydrogenase E2 component (dihydrolipoamide succinyltransferase)
MPTDVIMPQLGESIFEGTITKWLKKPGDPVEKDEPLFEISTDKVDAEIPSPVSGVLEEIKVPAGATVEINTVVAVVKEKQEKARNREQGLETGDSGLGPVASEGIAVVMPQMGESIFEGTITKWLKQVGERIEKDEPLFEISTDKVDAEIPAPVSGVLSEIRVPVGATVEINKVVAVIGGNIGAANVPAGTETPAPEVEAVAGTAQTSLPPTPGDGRRLRSSPLVRRIAKENQLDLSRIAGTGSEGRITKEDVLRHLSAYGPGSASAPTPAFSAPKMPPEEELAPPQELVPLTKMRAIIAQRMVESMQIAPHVHTVYKVDMTRVARLRAREKAGFERRHGVKLTFMPFVASAVVEALRKFPIVNASLEGGGIRYRRNINLGIAVALEWGLIVPVVRQAEGRTFTDLARTIADLAERARTKKLMPDEVAGSTFTLTNSGVFGDEFSTPIINQPDSAILCISGMKKEAVVLTDAEGNDTIAIRVMEHFTLGFDHRIIDGADACKFMQEFKKTLEGWNRPIG